MAFQVKPSELVQMIRQGQNPQQLMLNIMEQNLQGNPMYENLMLLARNNKTQDIEQIARNIAIGRGIDYDKEFNSFKRNLGL